MVPTSVQVIWTVLVVVLILGLPFIVVALHRALKAAINIERYMREMLTATEGIARNTDEIVQLDATVAGAGALLATAGGILENATAIHATLAQRAGAASQGDRP